MKLWLIKSLIIIIICGIVYYIKTDSGINFFEDSHWSDWFSGQVVLDRQKREGLVRDLFYIGSDNKEVGSNLLTGKWRIVPVSGVEAKEIQGVVEINFFNPQKYAYFNVSQRCYIKAGTEYKLSGYIRTDSLVDHIGVGLEIQDGRGWDKTHSAASTRKVTGTTVWQYVEVRYRTLPDARMVKVILSRCGDVGPLHGKAYFRDVKLERVAG